MHALLSFHWVLRFAPRDDEVVVDKTGLSRAEFAGLHPGEHRGWGLLYHGHQAGNYLWRTALPFDPGVEFVLFDD
jgi:hypothetical protein